MLVRNRVGSGATMILPPQPVGITVQIWAMGAGLENPKDLQSRTFISHSRVTCTTDEGVPLPMEEPILIYLRQGEALWAMSPDESFMGISYLG